MLTLFKVKHIKVNILNCKNLNTNILFKYTITL